MIKPRIILAAFAVLGAAVGQSAAQEPPAPALMEGLVGEDLEQPLEPLLPQAPKRQAGQRLPFAPLPETLDTRRPETENAETSAQDAEAATADGPNNTIPQTAVIDRAPKASPSLLDLGALRTDLLKEDTSVVEQDSLDTVTGLPAGIGREQDLPETLDTLEAEGQVGMAQPRIIQAQQLSSQDVASLGVLTEEQSGFSTRIWRNSRAANILAAWPQVPSDAPSPAMQSTIKSLALSVAAAPPVSDARAWALVDARLDALLRIGALKEAAMLSARIPGDFAPARILKKKADIALWAHQWSAACDAARIGLDAGPSRYWTGIALACRAVSGNRGAVDLLLDVLAPDERPGAELMQAVNALLDVSDPPIGAQGAPPQPEQLPEDALGDPLMHAIAVQLGQFPAPDQSFLDAPALSHASRANAPGAPLGVRWPGVSALAYRARMDGPDLVQFTTASPPTTPASPALGVSPADLQRPLSARSPMRRAEGLLALSQRGIASGLGQFWGPGIGHALSMVEPQDALWQDAGAIAAHLAFANETQALGQWYSHIRTTARSEDLAAAQSLINVWPYAVLLADDGTAAFTPRLAQLWLQSQSGLPADQRTRQAVYLYTALEALGYPAAPEIWADVGGTPVDDGANDFGALRLAAKNKEVGRGILLAFAALGPSGSKMPEPNALRAALGALSALGQERLARRLAAEVLFFSNVSLGNGR